MELGIAGEGMLAAAGDAFMPRVMREGASRGFKARPL